MENARPLQSDESSHSTTRESYAKQRDELGRSLADSYYAQLLLATGRKSEGMELLCRAELLVEDDDEGLQTELVFYHLAHDTAAWLKTLSKMRALLELGYRSEKWPLQRNVERAETDGHPNLELLRALAKVVADEALLSSLDSYSEWQSLLTTHSLSLLLGPNH
jgi:hypothetical protein